MEDPFFPRFRTLDWPPTTTAKPPRRSKVVSVPVHFVGSDETPHGQPPTAVVAAAGSKTTVSIGGSVAAVRIQSAFRGFLVRKNVCAVRHLETEIDAIDKEMKEGGERLRCDAKERLRLNEMLMSVLLRLDSVRGVRDHRRRAIRRAIALQEALDAIAVAGREAEEVTSPAGDGGSRAADEDAPRGALQARAPLEIPPAGEGAVENVEDGNQSSSAEGGEEDTEGRFEGKDFDGDVVVEEAERERELRITDAMEERAVLAFSAGDPPKFADEGIGPKQAMDEAPADVDKDKSTGDDAMEASTAQDDGGGGAEAKTVGGFVTGGEVPPSPAPASLSHDVAERDGGRGCGEAMSRAMERVAAESRDLKGLVAELFERNEMQCRLLSRLLQRVEHLEKVVDRIGRKKTRPAAGARRACARKCGRKL